MERTVERKKRRIVHILIIDFVLTSNLQPLCVFNEELHTEDEAAVGTKLHLFVLHYILQRGEVKIGKVLRCNRLVPQTVWFSQLSLHL